MSTIFNRHIKHINSTKEVLSSESDPLRLKKDQYAIQLDDTLKEGAAVWRVSFRNAVGAEGEYIELATIEDREGKNIFWGKNSGSNIDDSIGLYNTSEGYFSLKDVTIGIGNTAIGAFAGQGITIQSGNIVCGYLAADGILTIATGATVGATQAGSPVALVEGIFNDVWYLPMGLPPLNAGVYKYDKEKRASTFHSSAKISDGHELAFLGMAIDNNGVVWVSGFSGVYYYDKGTDIWSAVTSPYSPGIYTMRVDSLGSLWCQTNDSIQKIDTTSKQFTDQIVVDTASGQLNFDIDSNNNAWAITPDYSGLIRVELGTGTVTEYSKSNGDFSKEYSLNMRGMSNIHSGNLYLVTGTTLDVPSTAILKVNIASLIAGGGDAAITEYVVGDSLGGITVTDDGVIFVNDTAYIKVFNEGTVALQSLDISGTGLVFFLNAPVVTATLIDGYYWVPGASFDGMSPPSGTIYYLEQGDDSYTLLDSFSTPIYADNNVILGTMSAMNLGGSNNVIIGEGAVKNGDLTGGRHTIVGSRAGLLLADSWENILIGANAGSTLVSGSGNVLIGVNAGSALASDANDILAISSPSGSVEPLIFGDFALKNLSIGLGNVASHPNMLAMGRYGTIEGFIHSDEGGKLNLLTIGNGTDGSNRMTAFGVLETGTQWRSATQPSAILSGIEDILHKQTSHTVDHGASSLVDSHSSGPTVAIFYDYMVETSDNLGLPRLRSGTITVAFHPSGTFNSGEISSGNVNGDPLVSFTLAFNGLTGKLELTATNTDPVGDSIVSIRKRTMH